ncbi:hypothetical protein PORY_001634 [Pneumocystis oryctolagi]|uniref:Uncharacterized protein n=1 Tax=Pneumocystis oryctolagi TaxID=42067 RepID=A0ACB7CB52_9ASCO|nr:hypothetical protein PORY_001634 [Pneumocystis oryctolagi]
MVLLKFRRFKDAKAFYNTFNGELFNAIEPEKCHIMFIKHIFFESKQIQESKILPGINNLFLLVSSISKTCQIVPTSTKLIPSTLGLRELPTCVVCLERMDASVTGLLTILCQHTFHCQCLSKWGENICPVCRYSQKKDTLNTAKANSQCSVCETQKNLWICLICGHIGCGRYDLAHAYQHYTNTGHCYSMDIETERVWDYAGDSYVHRLIQNKIDGNLVKFPSTYSNINTNSTISEKDELDLKNKLESMSLEYTYLLTSQLDFQRTYYENKIMAVTNKAKKALEEEKHAKKEIFNIMEKFSELQENLNQSKKNLEDLKKLNSQNEKKAEKFCELAQRIEKELEEEKLLNSKLMQRIEHLNVENSKMKSDSEDSKKKIQDLSDQLRDVMFYISSQEQVNTMDDTLKQELQNGTIYRILGSEEISLVQFYFPVEVAKLTVSALGELGIVHFRDLNTDINVFQRAFIKEIRRLNELEHQTQFLFEEIKKTDIKISPIHNNDNTTRASSLHQIDDLYEKIPFLENRVRCLNESYQTLEKQYLELIELRHVLEETDHFFNKNHSRDVSSSDSDTVPLLENDVEQNVMNIQGLIGISAGFITGVIPRSRISAFERILWRVLRGNLYMNHTEISSPINDPITSEPVDKNVFIIFSHGKEINNKIRKISESLGATLYNIDEEYSKRYTNIQETNLAIDDLMSVLKNTKQTIYTELRLIADNIANWMVIIKKETAIYKIMNLFIYDQNHKCLISEGWCPTSNLHLVRNTLKKVTEQACVQMPSILNEIRTSKTPPTYHRTNKFTQGFQAIIDAYGVASYREANPGLIAIVTFPFLFAVMFGDLGHGFLMFIAALYLCLNEKKLERKKYGEIFDMAFYGRYIILLMSIFSMYTGLIYNDIFSKPMSLFKSGWEWTKSSENSLMLAKQIGVYPFGIDSAWHGSSNSLIFLNSYKMKMSVILGVIHMTFSLLLSLTNHLFFKSSLDIWTQFIPSFLFLQSIFGYMVFAIIYKWCVDWSKYQTTPPGILNMLIFMFLSPGKVEEPLYRGQAYVQVILLFIAIICIPWLLLAKPLILKYEHQKAITQGYEGISNRGSTSFNGNETDRAIITYETNSHFDFTEILIHQIIHTIEFCLGCLSHCASYLRLWALSLAHNQLSDVLWSMTLANAFKRTGVIGAILLVFIFFFWFISTVVVLCLMEGTSAMLHSLRLHWVEAMSKFYQGEGYAFEPFSFTAIDRSFKNI